jgi:hypothetical protein
MTPWRNLPDRLQALRQIVDHLAAAGADPESTTIGVATVDLDRAADALAAETSGDLRAVDLPPDDLLGATCRLVPAPGAMVVLLEPNTEGRLAASLVRFDEGPVALYCRYHSGSLDQAAHAAARVGIPLSHEAGGPFGRQRLVVGPAYGPHLVLTEADPDPAGTIAG